MVETAVLKSTIVQVGVCLLANCVVMDSGLVVGFPSAIMNPLLARGISLHKVSWVGSICFVSAPVSSLLAGPLLDRAGRTRSLQLVSLVFLAGWLLLASCPSPSHHHTSLFLIYAGRVLTGAAMGLAGSCAATYTAEVTSTNIRTPLVTLSPVMLAIGYFLVYFWALIYQDSWTELSYVGAILSLLVLLLSPLLPESPLWLVSQGRTEEASQQLMILRGASLPEHISEELHSLTTRVQQQFYSSWHDFFNLDGLKRPEAYKPLVIINVFFLFQQLSGVGIVIQYGVTFAQEAGIKSQAYTVALGIGAVRVIAAVLTTWACSHYGRRGPALLTGAIMSLSILTLWLAPADSPWLSGFLILLYVLSSSIGFSTLPWSMLGELFPTSVRGLASGITTSLIYVVSFIGAQLYPSMVNMFGSGPIFLLFGVSGLAGTYFLYRCLPETHGKTLAEIEEYFKETKHKEKGIEMGEVNRGFTDD